MSGLLQKLHDGDGSYHTRAKRLAWIAIPILSGLKFAMTSQNFRQLWIQQGTRINVGLTQLESFVLFSKKILDRDFDIFENDITSS